MKYEPTEEAIKNTKKFFKEYAAKNGKQLTDFQAETMVNTVIKSAQNKKDLQVYLLNMLMTQLQMKDQS